MGEKQHLHLDDYPATLALLSALLGQRGDGARLGYEATEHGVYVDWDRLTSSVLSSTEIATVQIARGCATLERAGGAPPRLASVICRTVEAVVGERGERPPPPAA